MIKSIVNKILEEYEEMYQEAVKAYGIDAKKYSDLKPGLKYIPAECPWMLSNLVSTSFDELLSMIPSVDEEDEERLENEWNLLLIMDMKSNIF